MAAIGRRICETEWDLCNLLRPDIVASLPEPATDPTPGFADAPHDAPGMADMLGAVGEFLDGTVREHLDPPAAFQARVASNLLGIAARQWDLGAGHAAAHTRRLEALGVADDAGLVAAIRRAEDPFGWDTAWRAVAADVRDKLLVANPRYLAAPAN